MPLTAGTRIGPYEIVCLIGAGGMGEVYRARDTTLDRDVALKVLPSSLAGQADRLTLFRREARVLASLNHPNIAHIHGFEEATGADGAEFHALVMELVEGPTIADRLAKGPLPIAEVLSIARQVADALESAHERNVIHRDLKPANIKVRADGTVKILDFGIAKAMELPAAGSDDPMSSPAFMATLTLPGALLGTAAYMSPEQARGKAMDRRTDIWAFGATVYEMLTGECLFGGDGISETLAAVLTRRVDWTKLPKTTPVALQKLLARCLDRDLKMRLRDIGEARIEIVRIANAESGPVVGDVAWTPPGVVQKPRPLPWIIAGASLVAAAAVLTLWAPWRTAPVPSPIRFSIAPPAGLPLPSTSVEPAIAISRDGQYIAYTAATPEPNLVIRRIDQVDAVPLPDITGARSPFFSPDGKWVAYNRTSLEVVKVSLSGGPPIVICKHPTPRGGTWASNGMIYLPGVGTNVGLSVVPETGGEPKMITTSDTANGEYGHVYPFALPDARGVLFTIAGETADKYKIAVLDLRTGRTKVLIPAGSSASYVDAASGGGGFLVYSANGALRAARFDLERLEVVGDSVAVGEQVVSTPIASAQYAVSASGTLVYMPGTSVGTKDPVHTLVWTDRAGHETPIPAPTRAYYSAVLSPDQRRIALSLRDESTDVWLWDFQRAKLDRFTMGVPGNVFPQWTPDGRRIIFGGMQGGLTQNLFIQPVDRAAAPTRLTTSNGSHSAASVSPDGNRVLFREVNTGTGSDIMMLTLNDGKVVPFQQTSFSEGLPTISPDGKMAAFEWGESGRSQIYVSTFPDPTKGRWQITDPTTGTGVKPLWSPTGKEIFFFGAGALWAVPVQTTPEFSAGKPVRLFAARDLLGLGGGRFYDVTRDGQRFVVIKAVPLNDNDPAAPKLLVSVHWAQTLAQKLPAK